MAIGMFAIVAPLQLYVGDASGLTMAEYQPAKLAAVEALWDTRRAQPFHVVAWPDRSIQANRWEVSIPRLGSLIIKHDANAEITGLKAFPRADQPPPLIVFYAFRIMVGLGLLMIALGLWGLVLMWRSAPERSRAFLWSAVAMGPAGFVCVVAGWVVAEVGRQPWVIYGVLRTADGVAPLHAGQVSASLIGFLVVYAVVFSVGALYMLRLINEGPVAGLAEPAVPVPRAPGTPMAAAPDQSDEEEA
jgi:cytochrome d ubiquinol oxidase subunit I